MRKPRLARLNLALAAVSIFALIYSSPAFATTAAAANVPDSGVGNNTAISQLPARASAQASYTISLPLVMRSGPAAANVSKIYWGALVDAVPPTDQALQPGGQFNAFEARAGKKMAILHWGQPWQMGGKDQPFQTEYFNNTRQHGSIPLRFSTLAIVPRPTR